ncbi:MAG: GNAT family N-acetyltransferase [Clostridia bacterium]|nr:GNAT family N-acetyltransferase [Clostridia bacterium]
MKTIETARLILRNFTEADADGLFELMGDEQTCLDDGGYHAYASKDDPGFLADAAFLAKSEEHYAVTLRETGRVVGLVHVMKAQRGVEAAELGYVISKNHRRLGYASEAVRSVIDGLFADNVRMIVCTCYEYNAASARMLESLGFTLEGRIRNSCNHPQKGVIDSLSFYLEKK